MSTLVSIIVPAYNCEKYIAATIRSCFDQTYQNFELIIVNDGSTDNTEQVILSNTDERIKYYKIENGGPSNARNFGLSKASGNLIQFLDADDILDKHKIQAQVEQYLLHGDDYIYSATMGFIIDDKKMLESNFDFYYHDLTPEQYFNFMFDHFGKYLTTGVWLTPRKLIEKTHGWDERAGLNDDGEYFSRLILLSKKIIFCKGAVFYYRRDVAMSFGKQLFTKAACKKWLFSYSLYVKMFKEHLSMKTAKRLGRKALSVYYCNSFPRYPELLNDCKNQIRALGYRLPAAHGGKAFKLLSTFIGVENALKLRALKDQKKLA